MSNLHISGLTHGCIVAIFDMKRIDDTHIDFDTFHKRMFQQSVDIPLKPGKYILRVRNSLIPCLPIEETFEIGTEKFFITIAMVRDLIVPKPDIALDFIVKGTVQWTADNYSKVWVEDNYIIIIDTIGIIKCQIDKAIVFNKKSTVSLLWEDPKLFDKIRGVLNV